MTTTQRRKSRDTEGKFFLYIFFYHFFSGIGNFFEGLFSDHDPSDF